MRDSELAARSNGIDVSRLKFIVYLLTACATGMLGALIFLMKLRISPDTAFSVNDWTASSSSSRWSAESAASKAR